MVFQLVATPQILMPWKGIKKEASELVFDEDTVYSSAFASVLVV